MTTGTETVAEGCSSQLIPDYVMSAIFGFLVSIPITVVVTLKVTHDRFWFEGYEEQMKHILSDCETKGYFYNRHLFDDSYKYVCHKLVQ